MAATAAAVSTTAVRKTQGLPLGHAASPCGASAAGGWVERPQRASPPATGAPLSAFLGSVWAMAPLLSRCVQRSALCPAGRHGLGYARPPVCIHRARASGLRCRRGWGGLSGAVPSRGRRARPRRARDGQCPIAGAGHGRGGGRHQGRFSIPLAGRDESARAADTPRCRLRSRAWVGSGPPLCSRRRAADRAGRHKDGGRVADPPSVARLGKGEGGGRWRGGGGGGG